MVRHYCDRCGRAVFVPENIKVTTEGDTKMSYDLCKLCVRELKEWVKAEPELNPLKTCDITIKEVNEDHILFSDGSKITCDHNQECCESNYADFKQVDNTAFLTRFTLPLKFEQAPGGFRFGNENNMFFVPCYSEQNGYYSDEVDIFYNGKKVNTIPGELVGC